jgi:hypothetical protein
MHKGDNPTEFRGELLDTVVAIHIVMRVSF